MKTVFALCACLIASASFAWGPDGHALVVLIAERHLAADAAQSVAKIAKGSTLSYMANWPDERLRGMDEMNFVKPWHYANLEKGGIFDESATAEKGSAIWAIAHYAEILSNPESGDLERWIALAWLAHLVGDIHQPLHCGYREDAGGNNLKVVYGGRTVSLHVLWDSALIRRKGLSGTEAVAISLDTATGQDVNLLQTASVVDMANESRGYLDRLYAGLEPLQGGKYRADPAYEDWAETVIRTRLLEAGIRLAGILNGIFSKQSDTRFSLIERGYYDSLPDPSDPSFRSELNGLLVATHARRLTYKDVWEALETLDEDPSDPDSVLLFYTQRPERKSRRDSGKNDGDSWNREHIWAKSHGFPSPGQWAYTDIHHLVATDRSVNSDRSNDDFRELDDELGGMHDECSCQEAKLAGAWYWEPPREVKGDVARMLFYMAVRYDGDAKSRTPDLVLKDSRSKNGRPEIGVLSDLLRWHLEDAVSEREIRRNDLSEEIQGNRNPFIDHPEWVALLWAGDS